MEFVDASGTRYQFTETSEAPAPAKKPVWPWVVGGLALVGGLVWMASSPRKANPVAPELEVLVTETRNPSTPFERLEVLAEHPEVEVRRAVLDNPNVCPTDEDGTLDTSLLEKLAKSLPEEVAAHPLFVLHALVEPDDEMRWVVVEVVGRTKEVGLIETLWRTWGPDDWLVRQGVAVNPNTPLDVLRILGNEATESEGNVRQAVAENPSTPEDALRILGNETTESKGWVRYVVARNPSTPEDTLRLLGNSKTESVGFVRQGVAENPTTPPDVLRLLGNQKTESKGDVRQAVASNPTTPEDALRLLGNETTESSWLVRRAVAQNPSTPEDALRLLGNSKTESVGDVRQAVAENRNTPPDVLRSLGNKKTEDDADVREAAMKALAARGLS